MMSTPPAAPGFFARIGLAFSVIGNAALAAQVRALRSGEATIASPAPESAPTPTAAPEPAPAPVPAPAPAPKAAPAPALTTTGPESALQLLALMQRDARLIDFCQENLGGYDDAQIGSAARLVHEGCVKVLREHFNIEPVRGEAEGSRVSLPAGFDAASVKLTGNVVGQAPFNGTLNHRGWRVAEVRLPQLAPGHDPKVIAPAEVEL
jgi:hypothetical protein